MNILEVDDSIVGKRVTVAYSDGAQCTDVVTGYRFTTTNGVRRIGGGKFTYTDVYLDLKHLGEIDIDINDKAVITIEGKESK